MQLHRYIQCNELSPIHPFFVASPRRHRPSRNRRMAGRFQCRGVATRRRARRFFARPTRSPCPPKPNRLVAGIGHALCEHCCGGGSGPLPRGLVDGRKNCLHHSLECLGHGGKSKRRLWRTRRSYRQLRQCCGFIRGGLQPFFPCTQQASWWRLGVFPTPQCTWRLRQSFFRRPIERARLGALPTRNQCAWPRGTRPIKLPTSLADAGLLAVSHRLYGAGAHQLHLPRPLHALPVSPPTAGLQSAQSVGSFWRWRNG